MTSKNKASQIITKNFRRYFEQSGMTNLEFANKIGVTDAAVSKWLKGQGPGLESLEQIADGLGITIKDLFEEQPSFLHQADEDNYNKVIKMMERKPDARWIITHMLGYDQMQLFILRENAEALELAKKRKKDFFN